MIWVELGNDALRKAVGEAVVAETEELHEEARVLREIVGYVETPARALLEQKLAKMLGVVEDRDKRLTRYILSRPAACPAPDKNEVARIKPHFNLDEIDSVLDDARQLLRAEAEFLKYKIASMHASVDQPSLVELRQFGARLEAEWLRRGHHEEMARLVVNRVPRKPARESGLLRRRPSTKRRLLQEARDERHLQEW